MIRKFSNVISAIPSTRALLKTAKPNIVSVFYHTVSSKPLPHLKHLYPVLSPQLFAQDINFLLKHFTPIDIHDLTYDTNTCKRAKPGLLLSFDDGFREVFTEVLPILKSKSVPATIFVNPHFVDNKDMLYRCKVSLIIEKVSSLKKLPNIPNLSLSSQKVSASDFTNWLKTLNQTDLSQIEKIATYLGVNFSEYLSKHRPYLSINQLKTMANEGFTIGAHSLNHPNFASLTVNEQVAQAEKSIQWVSENIPNQPKLFAFPFSSDGVSAEFFKHFIQYPSKECDMIFGTSGYKPTSSPKFMHRIPMEESNRTAQQIIKGELLYYLIKKMANRHKDNTVI
ncbi:MAG TPA: polysaccharide deacetylase family protein [Perlabentimonas sp.]|nr:polysaccharide deacetylase family protein [Bacteroidales bacterium]MDD4673715.1 polysaccharide deacetylase family protein [Bacteroidales bacterium]MDY0349000.1 polysaccharide deacetylase family protein [Tenuifilaceae bacterium]HZJ73571.1 polysaccharide deacetylase family protein [Perlabentimonas sp.]